METYTSLSEKIIPFHALIVAVGRGNRFGEERPKQYKLLTGKPLLRHSLDAFLKTPGLQSLTVVTNPEHEDFYREAAKGLDPSAATYGGTKEFTA